MAGNKLVAREPRYLGNPVQRLLPALRQPRERLALCVASPICESEATNRMVREEPKRPFRFQS